VLKIAKFSNGYIKNCLFALTLQIGYKMKKIYLSLLLLLVILLFQQCKKGTNNPSGTTPTNKLGAIIDGTTWLTDSVTATLTYDAATKTKVLAFAGTSNQRQISCAITLNNATNTDDFPIGTYTVNLSLNPLMVYSVLQKDNNGNYVYTPVATAGQNTGKVNYDDNGNVVSVTTTVIADGHITSLPYTFISK